MWKRISLVVMASLTALAADAQWTATDSLNLKRMLNGGEELKLNPNAVQQIDFGKVTGTPRISAEKNWMLPDESLPAALPDAKKVRLTLYPYTARTRYNWDPIYQKKLKVGADTWRGEEFYAMKMQRRYTHANEHPMEGHISLGKEVTLSGGTIGGLNLMRVFEKTFWNRSGNERRIRTLEVLKCYGDSVSIY